MTGVAHFRGHLFADLRGSTAFTQREGNAAGAELVGRFRQMVRDEVGEHQGAEVKTEGDAIYVVFPSASMAVMCGLALVEKAEQATADDPSLPIHMGVGIHAGEAVAVPEGGFIGTAVNLAARICAVAEAGEVLVSGTVREIVQGSLPVTFAARGKRRLKGIDDQVDLWRAIPEGEIAPARSASDRRFMMGAAGVLGIGALVILAFLMWPRGASPVASPTAVPQPTSQALRIGPLSIGEYVSTSFTPAFTMAVTDPGWAMRGERAASADFLYEAEPNGKLSIARLTGIHNDPCNPDGQYPIATGATPEELVEALRQVPYLEVGEAVPIQVDRKPGLRVDFRISDGVFAACDPGGADVLLFPLGSDSFGALPGDSLRIEAIPVGDQTVSFISTTIGGADVPVVQVEAFRDLAGNLVDGIRFSE